MTLHRAPRRLAATANLTGALSRDTPVPELSLPVSVPFATTPPVVARKLVIFAVIDSLEDVVAALAAGAAANATAAAIAASMAMRGLMPRRLPRPPFRSSELLQTGDDPAAARAPGQTLTRVLVSVRTPWGGRLTEPSRESAEPPGTTECAPLRSAGPGSRRSTNASITLVLAAAERLRRESFRRVVSGQDDVILGYARWPGS